MQHGTSCAAARLLTPALLLALAAAPVFAQEAQTAEPDAAALEAKLEALQRDMEEIRRQLENSQQRSARSGSRAAGATEGELEQLRRLAEEEARPEDEEEKLPTEKSFIARGLGLQALNPELSVAGDFQILYMLQEDERPAADFMFRVLDLHFQSYLDPYSKMKAAVEIHPEGAELGEAYFTRFGILPGLNFTAGKFRQQFGVVNRWHKHALDQIDFPLALRQIFGEGGLNQTGVDFEWTPPVLWGASQKLLVQLTEGENGRVFGENSRHLPSVLSRYQYYRDLSKDTYLDIGFTALNGWNDEWSDYWTSGGDPHIPHDTQHAWVLGGDLTIRWEPTERMRYAHFEWRTEFYYLNKGVVVPDGPGRDRIRAWGAYTSLQRQITRTLELGVRVDYFEPDSKSYAGLVAPLAVDASAPKQWQVGPYITWWQSPFVKFRLEVDYTDRYANHSRTGPSELTCALQIVFAAGPHKHERY